MKGLFFRNCFYGWMFTAAFRNVMQVFGTNPFCVSAPAAQASDRYLLDMSTSAVAVGKIEMQLRKGEPLPSRGWALGRDDQVGSIG